MGDVLQFTGVTSHEISPDRVLERSTEYGLQEVVIIGFDKDGDFIFASSMSDTGDILYWLERAKHELFKMEDKIRQEGDPRGKPGSTR